MMAALERVARLLASRNPRVREIKWPYDSNANGDSFAGLADAQRAVQLFETARPLGAELQYRSDLLSARLADLIEEGRAVSADAYVAAIKAGRDCAASIDTLFGDADVLLAPSAPGEAPHGLGSTGHPLFNRPWRQGRAVYAGPARLAGKLQASPARPRKPMKRWYGKLLGIFAGAGLMRSNPPLGALIGLLIGHAFDVDWFKLRRRDNPYGVLGLTEDASDAEIDQAYRRLIAQYHPDRMIGAATELRRQAEARAREINAAYDRIQRMRQRS